MIQQQIHIRSFTLFYILSVLALLLSSCAVSYKFNGASIDYSKTRTIKISDFPNHATLVYPPLSANLTDGIKDLFQRQTRLQITSETADLELEGEITDYRITPMAISADSYSAETKLTITVRVRFTNNTDESANFEKTYSAFQTFDSSQMLTDVEAELSNVIITEISESIYNDTVAKW